jgi:uncharacterized membrane protein YjgN (DUF898 family)
MTTGSVPGVPLPSQQTSVPAVGPWGAGVSTGPAGEPAATGQVDGSAAADRRQPFTWAGSPWDLAGTCFLNTLLAILTLGIYSFWGRTEIRQRLWSSVRFDGVPLSYHGTPRELLRGFFAVFAAVLVPLFVVGTMVIIFFGQASAVFAIYQFGLFAILYPILTAIAFYRGRRYRLSRTSWRGIRASLTGSSKSYAAISWLSLCAVPLTFFLILPYRAVALQRAIVDETTLGNARLRFEGSAGPVYKRFALLWCSTILLTVGTFVAIAATIGGRFQPGNPLWWTQIRGRDVAIILGASTGAIVLWSLISSFYYSRLYNYLAHATVITNATPSAPPGSSVGRFHLDVTGKRIIWLFVTNALITYLSLFILKPVAMARTMKYYAENLSIVGPFDPGRLGQNPAVFDPKGEGLAQAFDLDAF